MKVYFIRHGESEVNVRQEINEDVSRIVHLTPLGKKQAEEAGKKLKGKGIEVIFCSPFTRTKETAEILNKVLKKKIIVDKRIREIYLGFEGENVERYREARRASGEGHFNFKIRGAENFADAAERFKDFIEELRSENYDSVLVVTHEIGLMLAGYLFGKVKKEEVAKEKFGNCEIVEFEL